MDPSLKILHPDKDEFLPLEDLQNYFVDNYYKIINAKEEKKLTYFLSCFEKFREDSNQKITNPSIYQNLPFSIKDKSWKARQEDVIIINKLINNRKELKILDIGSWNGWLSNYLTKKGHDLVAVNMFTDPTDGLQAHKNYKTKFISLQLLTDEIYRIQNMFDVIIFNRNWAYFENHEKVFNDAKKNLSKEGVIVFTGLTIYKNNKKIITQLNTITKAFKKKYDIPLLYTKSKGYLDKDDLLFLKKNTIKIKSRHILKNFLSLFLTKRFKSYYGIYKQN